MAFRLACVHIIFGSVSIAGWPPFGKWLLARLTIRSLWVLAVCDVGCFAFWFWGAGFEFWLLRFLIFAYLLF